MRTAERIIAGVCFGQLGLATHGQLLASGVTRDQIEYRVAARTLVPVHREVYRMAAVAPTYEQRVLAACLATGGVASHRSAAALFRLRGFTSWARDVRRSTTIPPLGPTGIPASVASATLGRTPRPRTTRSAGSVPSLVATPVTHPTGPDS